MKSIYAAPRGALLLKTPNARHQAERRRAVVVCAVLALALASALVGAAVQPDLDPSAQPATGPFSYFPSQ